MLKLNFHFEMVDRIKESFPIVVLISAKSYKLSQSAMDADAQKASVFDSQLFFRHAPIFVPNTGSST
jgi:hypothetical protein